MEAVAQPVFAAASLAFVVLFFTSAKHKIDRFDVFRFVLDDYRLLPSGITVVTAGVVVVLEVALAVGWLVAFVGVWGELALARAIVWIVAFATMLLLVGYALAMASLLLRGRVHVDCGCSSNDIPVSYRLVVRNVVMAAVPAALLLAPPTSFVPGAVWVGVALGIVAVTLYAGFNQLAANAAEQSTWVASRP